MFQGVAANFERYMTLLSERQKLVASNIANVDTPGFHTKDLDFHTALDQAMDGGSPTVVEPENLATKSDGNNVDLDREARLLAENALRFQIATNFARGELADIKLALQDGKG
jgi:flagellar basal-body rod protein FlgB